MIYKDNLEVMNRLIFLIFASLIFCGCRYGRVDLPGMPYASEPNNAELLYEVDDLALFAGETESDIAFNKSNDWLQRNSLFMRRRMELGREEWRLVMTAEGDWRIAEGMDEWCNDRAKDARRDFCVMKASLSKDRQSVWVVCDPHIGTYYIVGRLDLRKNTFRVLIDGDTAEEQPDGTILVKGKKTYLSDENGESLGAAWYDLWMTPDGKVIRKTKPVTAQQMQDEWQRENEGTKNDPN